jgi:ribosome-associated translation inhibitor RaiA
MLPLSEIRFLDAPASAAVERRIRDRAHRLSRFSRSIQNWQVWIESPRGHHRQGPITGLRVRLTVPGEEIVTQAIGDDVFVCVRNAFDAARRKLQDYERRRRGEVKAHPSASTDRSRVRRVPPRAERESAPGSA